VAPALSGQAGRRAHCLRFAAISIGWVPWSIGARQLGLADKAIVALELDLITLLRNCEGLPQLTWRRLRFTAVATCEVWWCFVGLRSHGSLTKMPA
jgi:hypothetical protein